MRAAFRERPKLTGRVRKVLVVDDDDGVRAVTYEMLSRLDYHVSVAHSGSDALSRASKEAFDVYILDVAMPGMSGDEVYETLKARQRDLRVVFMTGYAKDEVADLVDADDHATFLHKPFQFSSLKASLDEVLSAA